MDFLQSKPLSYLGIDIGSTSIKVVELRNDQGRPRLVTYGFSESGGDAIFDSSLENIQKKADTIVKVIEKANTHSTKVVTALPTFAVFSSVLSFPASLTDKDLPSAIRWEAKKVIPLPIEEMSLSWNKLPEEEKKNRGDVQDSIKDSEGKGKGKEEKKKFFKKKSKTTKHGFQKILLTGAPNKLVQKYIENLKRTGLKLMSLETESFALVRSLVGNDPVPAMIVNFGSVTTTITVVQDSIAILNRSIDVGGRNITKMIAESLHIDSIRAAHFKQDVGLIETKGGSIPKMISQALSPVVNEIKYTRNVWQNQSNQKIRKIILTGGSANLPELSNYLSHTLELRTFLGDPWARVVYPEELKPVLNDTGSKLAVSVGLAMRNII